MSNWSNVGKARIAKIVRQYGMGEFDRCSSIRIETYQRPDTRTRWTCIGLKFPLMNGRDGRIHQQWMAAKHAIACDITLLRDAQPDVDFAGSVRGQGLFGIDGPKTLCNARPHLFRLDVLNSPGINLWWRVCRVLGITRYGEQGCE